MRIHKFKANTTVTCKESGAKFKIVDIAENMIIIELGRNYNIKVETDVERFGKNKGREYFVFGFERVYAPLELTHMELAELLIDQMLGYKEMLDLGLMDKEDFERLTSYDAIGELIEAYTSNY